MTREELIDKIYEAIVKMKEETNKGVIKEHTINTVVNWKTGEEKRTSCRARLWH